MTQLHHRRHDEDGSLLLALLAVLIIGGLVTVLMASTVTGQRQAQFDRNFSNAIHPADSGVEAAITWINTQEADPATRPAADPLVDYGDTGTVGGGYDFTWTATKVTDQRWEIRATGTAPDGTDRIVEALIAPQPVFRYAAFAKTLVGLGGGNSADSYDWTEPATDTGAGIVGSNGVIHIDNNATANAVDGVELHDFHDDPDNPDDDQQDDIGYRLPGTCGNCGAFQQLVEDGGKLYGLFDKPLVLDEWWIQRTLDRRTDQNPSSMYYDPDDTDPDRVCNADFGLTTGDPLPTQIVFEPGQATAYMPDASTRTVSTSAGIPGGVYCAGGSGVRFEGATGSNIDVQGLGDARDDVMIYTDGQVQFASQLNINCGNAPYTCANGYPISTDLQVYSLGPELFIANQANVASVLYAPRSLCKGPTSNASADVYGAVVCNSLSNVGGWSFHFDENARRIATQEFAIESWREEPTGTSF